PSRNLQECKTRSAIPTFYVSPKARWIGFLLLGKTYRWVTGYVGNSQASTIKNEIFDACTIK
ncbi:MAG: hypothetical protein EBS72_13500, partial [Rhizobiales bacterium]|nr:hypothetical protein [Hyphomicrobiales bacterium]